MKILLIGGNRFFGKRLAHLLVGQNHEVTLLNRGNRDDELGDKVKRVICDRDNPDELRASLKGETWDVVYDQVCYDYDSAKTLCEILGERTGRIIFTSSQSVYDAGAHLTESGFDPEKYRFSKKETKVGNYGEAKRQAEVAFSQYSKVPVILVRFPIVIGKDDYTGRFDFHVSRIRNGDPIFFPNMEAKISFISSHDASKALAAFANTYVSGPINVASPDEISLKDFVGMIEKSVGKQMKTGDSTNTDSHSPYGINEDWFMDCSYLKKLDLVIPPIKEWLSECL